jgi:hypothetical protein
MAIGLDSTAASRGDVSLYNEIIRVPVVSTYQRGVYHARYAAGFRPLEPPVPQGGTSNVFRELGLFDAGTVALTNRSFETWSGGNPTGWTQENVGSIGQGSSTPYEGNYYAAVGFNANGTVSQTISSPTSYAGKTVFWVGALRTSDTDARVVIDDGVSKIYSDPHSGSGSWELLKAIGTVSASPTQLKVGYCKDTAGTVDLDWATFTDRGNLWARAIINVEKLDYQPLQVIWEIFFEEQDEEGQVPYTAFAQEEITVGTVAVGLTSDTYAPTGATPAQEAEITVDTNKIRYWKDGSTPTSSSGHEAYSTDVIKLKTATEVQNFKAIRSGSSDATIKVTYKR